MSVTSSKEIVKKFYAEDLLKNTATVDTFFDPEVKVIWNSSEGLSILGKSGLKNLFNGMRSSYADLRVEISHVLAQRNFVTVRHKYYVRTIENPEEEIGIAHFIAIWELKDGKIFRGHVISQPASKKDETTEGYEIIKI